MADSFSYETGTITDGVETGGTWWEVVKKCVTFIEGLGNGWSRLDYSGFNRLNTGHEEYLTQNPDWNPVNVQADHEGGGHGHGSDNTCPYVLLNQVWYNGSGSDFDTARSAYFKWTDGVDDSYFYMTTLSEFGEAAYSEMRLGVLFAPYEENMYFGSLAESPIAYLDGFAVCQESVDPPSPNYDENFCNLGAVQVTGDNPYDGSPWSYRQQPGYRVEGEARVNASYDLDLSGSDPYTYHLFGGVENGVPFLYCVLESTDIGSIKGRMFTHFSFGKIAPIGDFKGGEFANGMSWSTQITEHSSLGNDGHSRPFDSEDSRDADFRSFMRFDTDLTPFDSEDENTWGKVFQFGNDLTTNRCYGDSIGGMNTPIMNDANPSSFTGKSQLLRNFIRVRDVDRSDGTYFIAGMAPAFRSLMLNGVQPLSEITDRDGSVWIVFPVRNKEFNNASTAYSGDYGFAYRKS